MQLPLANFMSPTAWLIVIIAAMILFGSRRIPELARSLGKGIVEFKKGLKGLEDDIETSASDRSEPVAELPRPPQRVTPAGPRFDNNNADKPATHS